ncbi:hypothetical protein chiPu_0028848, partial [Chiloscyllium punctatum]|nr:hypothetical protein [Chiloscyllium punctatum]
MGLVIPAARNDRHLGLWVPAFAGTTLNLWHDPAQRRCGSFLRHQRRGDPLRLQEADDLGVRPGAAEQEALALVAALGAQAAQLRLGLDALGGDGDAEP